MRKSAPGPSMSFRTRLLLLVTATILTTVALVTWAASTSATRSFEELDTQRTAALVAQFRAEFTRRGEEVLRRAEGIAASQIVVEAAIEANRSQPDFAPFFNRAQELATSHGLPFVEIVDAEGRIISSAQWPARFGYREEAMPENPTGADRAFLRREDLPSGKVLALMALRPVSVGHASVSVLAGLPLGDDYLKSIVLPEGVRALLFPLLDSSELLHTEPGEEAIGTLVYDVRASGRELTRTLTLSTGEERFTAIPLHGLAAPGGAGNGAEGELLGVLVVGSSRRELRALLNRLRWEGAGFAALGFLLAMATTYWIARRITQPLEELAKGAQAVASGAWETRVDLHSGDEVEQLANDFNRMTAQLLEQRDRLVQSERVAAWRELARRLAHELKNPLFPLQITVENLQRARAQAADQPSESSRLQFEEVFREGTSTLLAELGNLKTIIGRFSDFARMPPPEMQTVDPNELVRESLQLFEAQFVANPEAKIVTELRLDAAAGSIDADPELLRRALRNLILNAIDAMPDGGTLKVVTERHPDTLVVEVSDSGGGLTEEEAARLFTPYYTTRRHGTGLGLAIVQSVVADHKGRIHVDSQPGHGATFRIELPLRQGVAQEEKD